MNLRASYTLKRVARHLQVRCAYAHTGMQKPPIPQHVSVLTKQTWPEGHWKLLVQDTLVQVGVMQEVVPSVVVTQRQVELVAQGVKLSHVPPFGQGVAHLWFRQTPPQHCLSKLQLWPLGRHFAK